MGMNVELRHALIYKLIILFAMWFTLQVNRRAAVRLMFETASTGVLTDGSPIYGDGRVDQSALAAAETVYSSLLDDTKVSILQHAQ